MAKTQLCTLWVVFVESTVLAIAHAVVWVIISPIDWSQCQIEWRVLNVEQNCLFTNDNTVTATIDIYIYLLQLNKATFRNVQLKAGTFI